MKSSSAVAAGASLVLALALTGQSATAGAGPAASSRPPAAAAPIPNGAWTVYHHDSAHTGYDGTQPQATGAVAGWVSQALDGSVYGEPLVYNGIVYVSTLQNTVYALDQSTGAVVWSQNVGAPQTSGWQCGNINPTGILGTGVIDTAASRIYVVGFLHQFLSYYLFGMDLATGTRVLTKQIAPVGFDWKIQQERGALALSTDGTHVYVPFGGRAGDCGAYHGWVIGVPTTGITPPDEQFVSASTGEGMWAAGGVVVDDSTGHVFVATGNAMPNSLCTSGPGGASQSDSVIETNAALGGLSYFQPLDWAPHWCGPDSDLGSASPVLMSPSLMFMSGKHGQGFLLNPAALGGPNGQLFPASALYTGADVCLGNHADATFGSFAYAAPRVYLECEGHGLVSLTVNAATPSFSTCDSSCTAPGTWKVADGTTFGPPMVAGGAVWAVDINGGGLSGFDASTGAKIYQSSPFSVTHFSTPSEAGGQIFVSSSNMVRSFGLVSACATMSATAAPPTTAVIGTRVTVTGSASGPACTNPRYQFWLLPPGGIWSVVQLYSPTATYGWDTAGLAAGTYRFSVWARDALSGTAYDSFGAFNYVLTATTCGVTGASAAPPSSADVGNQVIVTGSASGCPNPRYLFWLLPPGGSWTQVQPYSASATFTWNTAGRVPGVYRFSVWVRDASSPGTTGTGPYTYDSFNAFNYSLTTCSGMSATAAPPTSADIGTPVTVTGSATGCTAPRYQFWLLPPGGTWTVVQPYSATTTYMWSTTGRVAGTYRFSVWARDAGSAGVSGSSPNSYDAFFAFAYSLTVAPCTGMSTTAAPANTASRGTDVTVTGSATGCPNPQYELWLLSPGGTWTLVQGWSANAPFVWHTTGMAAGTYRFSVWARDASSPGTSGNPPATYDAFNAFNYTLT